MSQPPNPEPTPRIDAINALLRDCLGAKFGLIDRVRHVTQAEGKPGIVTGINLRPTGLIYLVTWSHSAENGHDACELVADEESGWVDP